jgi:murein DD-endopeptidase MepM/ murein hydrolase activator NlpD
LHTRTSEYAVFRRVFLALAVFVCSPNALADQSQNYPFSIESEKESDGHRIVARNNGPAPVSVKVSISDSQYITTDRPFPVFAVVPPGGGTLYLAHIRPAMTGVGYSFRTQSSWVLGDFNAQQSADALYRLPYRDGMAYHIGQAPGGPVTTHTAPDSLYAVDIGLPEGAPIFAARDGVVIHTEANQVYGGQSPDMMSKANEVRILHVDGTIAVYAHLAHGGVYVYPGQRVTAGTQIGLAGSTGYSSGPHLHFAVESVVRSGDGLAMVSVPIQFYVGNPPVVFAPQFGMLVSADYSSPARMPAPGRIPGVIEAPQVAKASATNQAATGNREMVVSFDVPAQLRLPAPLRAWLLHIPAWQWAMGTVSLIFLLVWLDSKRKDWLRVSQMPKPKMQEPTLRSRPAKEPPKHGLSSRDKLVIASGGDRQRADRLQEYEYHRSPGISNEEAAQRAWERLQRDRD